MTHTVKTKHEGRTPVVRGVGSCFWPDGEMRSKIEGKGGADGTNSLKYFCDETGG